ncbi:hypothetical protein MJG53_006168 [Ovis ammon polii x Ovis aries]|uniref:Uncharacterized protein n=1 Tax=Ovis ammon polii x Ovis aries TaxID=2918886 RepID=A0ACB9V7L6_9CETA|nr:hypothetical protein MJG53_006168 [Ovis ammon polii x Ovis aries]
MRPISAEASRGYSHLTTGTSKGSFTPLLHLKKFPALPVSTREEAPGSRTHPGEPRFRLLARDEGSFPCFVGKEFPAFPSHLKRRRSPQERREELQGRANIPRVPQMFQSIPEEPVFLALPGRSSRGSTPTRCARGTALCESLLGKPHGKDSRENHRSFAPRGGLRDTAATALEESASACPHWRRGLTPLGRLQKYPKIHVSTGEESSGSGPDSTQGLRPRHRRESNPERPPRNSPGDWPFLRPAERLPEVPVVSREHLPQLEKIQEVLPSRRDEAHFR